ncbi:cytochrome c peroxidase [Martelella sp. HB161492]|uniref:cytochrome-c peroxidase n=1 Tax=Martelella sp. HB161492 TaxID=2720726 RepID=UPI0015914B42|nr:cytochrome c peroxidase [Martelella sp. HB161492]
MLHLFKRVQVLPAIALAGLALAGAVAALADSDLPPAKTIPAGTDQPPLSAVAHLGEDMFFDTSLSGSGEMSCATCHDPKNHYAPANDLAVQRGGAKLDQPGYRTVPTLTYAYETHPFSIGPLSAAEEINEAAPMAVAAGGQQSSASAPLAATGSTQPKAADPALAAAALVPEGGLFRDGRVDTLEEQAHAVLRTPFEMANDSDHALYQRIRAHYGAPIAALFGKSVLDDESMTIAEAAFALARYQMEAPGFHAFDSKYDFYLRGRAVLSPAEARGLKLFDDPAKGNCASCHIDTPSRDGRPPMFTDYEYEALGVPRNPEIPANADPDWHDLGICGPMRDDAFARAPENCGLFKTPTLRNVATRHAFFHNGRYHTLEDVLHFYVERDTDPAAFYPTKADGTVDKYDDLPAQYHGNVDVIDAPFDRKPGDQPALDEQEIRDITAFLNTLTDGYQPAR